MNQSQFNTLLNAFSHDFEQTLDSLKQNSGNALTYFLEASQLVQQGGFKSYDDDGFTLDYLFSPENKEKIGILYLLPDNTFETDQNRIRTAIGLALLSCLPNLGENPINVRLIFQSRQNDGPAKLVSAGCLQDVSKLLEVSTSAMVPDRSLAIKEGVLLPQRCEFAVLLKWPSSNNEPKSFASVISLLSNWLLQLPTRQVDPLQPASITIQNVDYSDHSAKMCCYLESTCEQDVENTKQKIEKAIVGFSDSLPVRCSLNWEATRPSLKADDGLVQEIAKAAIAALGEDHFFIHEYLNQDHSELSPYLLEVPGAVIYGPAVSQPISAKSTSSQSLIQNAVIPLLKVVLSFLLKSPA